MDVGADAHLKDTPQDADDRRNERHLLGEKPDNPGAVDSESASTLAEQANVDNEKGSTIDVIPDGGYGWVVVACVFLTNSVTWGLNSTFGVYNSFYIANNYFSGGTDLRYAMIGGLSVSAALVMAPISNYLAKRIHFKAPIVLGIILTVLGQAFAGISRNIGELFVTQGLMFGVGIGLIFIPLLPIVSQFFLKRRALALGISAAGSGAGGLVLSNTTRLAIDNISIKWALVINALISLVVLVPCVILIKGRVKATGARFEPLQVSWIWHPSFCYVWVWGFFSILGYILALYSLPAYATAGLGLSQTKGAALQSILAAGQMVGRPLIGWSLDLYGRFNMTILFTLIAGISCIAIWLPARSFGVLAFYALVQGICGGTIWASCSAVTAELIGLQDLGSALSIFWLAIVLPAQFAQPIAVGLNTYSASKLGRTGPEQYAIGIGFAGATFLAAGLVLILARHHKQQNWKLFVKT
ncbi:uncharacterized protein L969DRAFT_16467 [Mixia osmundae IAM 14324]|uniref:Major facilitator superfamily (MFS) profile domain-containing protein n=1 Tax=Mixia osmundae (strain CBS 9802 / IAM 14324 / JCM 22182 / KY 12970) TaxID=764103 RepID=G7DUI5_MIXOS|nr:uncharacterized protein L969DRAFT_16467 [Mixia osmundae IAM 14324]KEI41117.1 hypothetical protein L969DRAFT_16467 [Mixia osmundae IAM 14324]GAA94245.1 hypothetical protein E5Q_00894 [Mixia osmundae IAM 14324]